MSVLVDIATTMAELLAAAPFSMPITVMRGYVLPEDLSTLDGVRVTVVPAASVIRAFDLKGRQEFDPGVSVWVQAKVNPTAGEIDPLLELVEEIAMFFRPGTRLQGTGTNITAVENDPAFDRATLDTHRLFQSGLTFTFMFTR